MSPRIVYPLQRSGNLLFLRASINGANGDSLRVRLLVDTGSSYTTLPINLLEDLGYDISAAANRRIACLGQSFSDFPIAALDLPFNPLMSGLLGMDFLSRIGATIDIKAAQIIVVN